MIHILHSQPVTNFHLTPYRPVLYANVNTQHYHSWYSCTSRSSICVSCIEFLLFKSCGYLVEIVIASTTSIYLDVSTFWSTMPTTYSNSVMSSMANAKRALGRRCHFYITLLFMALWVSYCCFSCDFLSRLFFT